MENEDTEKNSKQGSLDYYWDIFKKDNSENEDEKTPRTTESFLRVVKVLVYVLLFILVFGGSIVTKASLQILTNELHKDKKSRYSTAKDAIAYYILFILAIPDAVQLLLSCFIFSFGKRTLPTLRHIVNMVVKECLHMFFLAIIVFKVMPKLNSVEVCAFLAGIPLVPSILQKITFSTKCFKTVIKRNICLTLLQAATVCAVPLYKTFRGQITTDEAMWMIFASVFVSIRWVDTYFRYNREPGEYKQERAYDNTIETQSASTLVTSFCRLVLIIVLFPIYFAQNIQRPEISLERKPELHMECPESQLNITCCTRYEDTTMMSMFFVHFVMCMVLYYAAVLATRICMDQICFCAALAFGAPVYVVIILISRVNDNWIYNTFIKDVENTDIFVMAVVFVIAWLSQLWICRHIWNSPHDRVLFKYKLFVLPHYCSPIADLSLLHSRWNVSDKHETNYSESNTKTKVYICATMWHENRTEMKQIMKTLFRLNKDQTDRSNAHDKAGPKKAQEKSNENDTKAQEMPQDKVKKDCYTLEAHIFFDDAMKTENQERVPNEFVQQLVKIITDVEKTQRYTISSTPYGEQLVYTMPGGNKLVVHLKDKDKIRHKKRWSQVMYMYYLLGYELLKSEKSDIYRKDRKEASPIFKILSKEKVEEAANTYILALDGDVDFSPDALQLLIDRMKTNPKVGAACGRIKPGGSGPVVWYQKFEYAIGHWLQKSAEHVFGCVLCSPGCFSLFRAKALMDDNIMRMYASMPTEPKHYLQYDQGEDRWLCTLMLQQGYRIEYCAAAEAITFAPEEFREFFNQRRRWVPSTMANILDLLISYKRTTIKNSNISRLYIFYQGILFLSSILGPSLILLVMQSAITSVFKESVSSWVTYLLIYGPILVYIFICFKCKTQTQLTVAIAFSAIYALFMVAVLVGTVVNIAEEGLFTPNSIFMYVLVGIFLLAGLFHPHDLTDLFWGFLYLVCIPAGYLLLMVYAICNLNNISWGTRESQTAVLEQSSYGKQSQKQKLKEELRVVSEDILDDILKQIKATKTKDAWYSDLIPAFIQCHNNRALLRSLESIQNIVNAVNAVNTVNTDTKLKRRKKKKKKKSKSNRSEDHLTYPDIGMDPSLNKPTSNVSKPVTGNLEQKADDPGLTTWDSESQNTDSESTYTSFEFSNYNPIYNTEKENIPYEEETFWKNLIKKYLQPIDSDKRREMEIAQSLKEYRDKVAFAFFFVNALWVVVMSAMNEVKSKLNIKIPAISTTAVIEPLGIIFISIFTILIFLQFIGMMRHRYGTLIHLLSATTLRRLKHNETTNLINTKSETNETHGKAEPVGNNSDTN